MMGQKLSKRTQRGPKGPKQSTKAHNGPKGLKAQSGSKLLNRPKVTKIIQHSSKWPKMTTKFGLQYIPENSVSNIFLATVGAAVSAIIVLTLIGSSVMDATHLILISPYLKISYSSYSLLRNIFNFQCLYLYNINTIQYKDETKSTKIIAWYKKTWTVAQTLAYWAGCKETLLEMFSVI